MVSFFKGTPNVVTGSGDEARELPATVGGSPLAEDFNRLAEMRLEHLVAVREPLVLISQIQRSGGTLLGQLFDSHPQCHAFPPELDIGYPNAATWPVLDLTAGPRKWFDALSDGETIRRARQGYTKAHKALRRTEPEAARHEHDTRDVLPFLFAPALQETIFECCIANWGSMSQRDLLDAYMTSYFNAWLDNHNLYAGPKQVVTGFKPQLATKPENTKAYFDAYPNGTLVSIVREPKSWFTSRKHERQNLKGNVGKWRRSVETLIEQKQWYGPRMFVLAYEDLVRQPEEVMRQLAESLGIEFHPSLLEPTFNGFPIKADSSFRVDSYGIITEPLARYRDVLTEDECRYIDRTALDLYEDALALRSYELALKT